MTDELRMLLKEVSNLPDKERTVYTTWLVIQLIRDVAYYVLAAIVAYALGRRLINAMLTAYRESKRAA